MLPINDPGPWQHYVQRKDNIGLSIESIRRKYLAESILFEEQIASLTLQNNQNSSAAAGGGTAPITLPTPLLPSNCIEFVIDTGGGTFAGFTVQSSALTTYTLTWGDGNEEIGEIDGEISFEHNYADEYTEYTVKICFDNTSLITHLDFPGND
jgi:hypothetical protein